MPGDIVDHITLSFSISLARWSMTRSCTPDFSAVRGGYLERLGNGGTGKLQGWRWAASQSVTFITQNPPRKGSAPRTRQELPKGLVSRRRELQTDRYAVQAFYLVTVPAYEVCFVDSFDLQLAGYFPNRCHRSRCCAARCGGLATKSMVRRFDDDDSGYDTSGTGRFSSVSPLTRGAKASLNLHVGTHTHHRHSRYQTITCVTCRGTC